MRRKSLLYRRASTTSNNFILTLSHLLLLVWCLGPPVRWAVNQLLCWNGSSRLGMQPGNAKQRTKLHQSSLCLPPLLTLLQLEASKAMAEQGWEQPSSSEGPARRPQLPVAHGPRCSQNGWCDCRFPKWAVRANKQLKLPYAPSGTLPCNTPSGTESSCWHLALWNHTSHKQRPYLLDSCSLLLPSQTRFFWRVWLSPPLCSGHRNQKRLVSGNHSSN